MCCEQTTQVIKAKHHIISHVKDIKANHDKNLQAKQ